MSLIEPLTPASPGERAQPKYEQLCARLITEIRSGRLKPGDLLPAEPLFAEKLNVARSTVRQALARMERDGLVRRVRGKGTYVHEDAGNRLGAGLDVFALLIPEQAGFYPLLMSGFEEAAAAARNQVIVVSTRNDNHRQGDAILQLIDKQVAGVAMVPTVADVPTPAYQVRQLQKNLIPVVMCHREVQGVRAPVLALSGQKIGSIAADAMIRRGHRRIAFVSALRSPMAQAYEAALRRALEEVGLSLPTARVIYAELDLQTQSRQCEEATESALRPLLEQPPDQRPTAIFASFDTVAEMIFLMLMRWGIKVPEEVSLVSFGGATRLGAMQHRISAVTVDEAQTGRRAAELLSDMRLGRRPIESDESFEIPLGFHEGQTLIEHRD